MTKATRIPWRRNILWAVLLGSSFIIRTAVDWLAPSANSHTRAVVSTWIGIGILLLAGFWSARRTDSFWTGAFTGMATTFAAAIFSIAGVAGLLVMYHDRQTMMAIQASGGLEEAFVLPVMLVLPGVLLGAVGGFFGGVFQRVR